MLDIRFVRDNLEMVKQAMQDLQALDVPLDAALALDDERRKVLTELETLRARRNTDSRRIGQLLREGQHEAATTLKAELAALPNGIAALEERLA
ncbi:MAG: serine--tRNA ligase, partial [Anaerolineae bacterium]